MNRIERGIEHLFQRIFWRRSLGNTPPPSFTPPPPSVEVASAAISPATVSLDYGLTQQFTLVAKDAFGTVIASPPAPTWFAGSNKDGSAWGTVDSSGLFTASKNDPSDLSGFIHAIYPNGVGSQFAAVTETLLDHLSIDLSSKDVVETDPPPTITLHKWRDAAGTTAFIGTTSISYASDNISVATIDPATGAITLQGPGDVNLTATDAVSGKTAQVALTVTAGVITFDSASFDTATGAGIGGSTGAAPDWFLAAPAYSKDSDYRADIWSGQQTSGGVLYAWNDPSLVGTNPTQAAAKIKDGVNPDLSLWLAGSDTNAYAGTPVFQCTIAANDQSRAEASTPAISGFYSGGSTWFFRREKTQPSGFSHFGNAVSGTPGYDYNNGIGSPSQVGEAWKHGPMVKLTAGGGRAGIEGPNTWLCPGTITNQGDSQDRVVITNEYDGAWRDWAGYVEWWDDADGNTYQATTIYMRHSGDANYHRYSGRRVVSLGVTATAHSTYGTHWNEISPFGLNFNQSNSTPMLFYVWGVALWAAANNADPLGILASVENTAVPAAPSSAPVYVSQTDTTITVTVTPGMFAKKIRFVIDGVDNSSANDVTVPASVDDWGTMNVALTGISAGSHTFAYKVVNGNGVAGAASATLTETFNGAVTAVSITPSTFTLAAGGSTQQLTAESDLGVTLTSGVTWSSSNTAIATVDANGLVTSVASGSVVITAAYSGATSGTSDGTVSGGIDALPTLTVGVYKRRYNFGIGLDQTVDGGAITTITDQKLGVVMTTGSAGKPVLRKGILNGRDAAEFTGVEWMGEAANDPALNPDHATGSVYVLAILQMKAAGDGTGQVIFDSSDFANNHGYQLGRNSSNEFNYWEGYNTGSQGGATPANTDHLTHGVAFWKDGVTGGNDSYKVFLDGVGYGNLGGNADVQQTVNPFTIGNNGLNAYVAEVLWVWFPGVPPNATDIAALHTYAQNYGTA